MLRPPADDCFQEKTMSFGEHLEELRGAVLKGVIALAIGMCFGLWIGDGVVAAIANPLRKALVSHYEEIALEDYKKNIAASEATGQTVPPELKDEATLRKVIEGGQMLFQESYIRPQELLGELHNKYPDQIPDVPLKLENPDNPLAKENLLRVYIWHRNKDDSRIRVMTTNIQEGFIVWMKAGLLVGALVSSPFVFYFLWQFVAAGLYSHEKRYVHIFMPFSIGLFLLGAAVAYFVAFPLLLRFFLQFNQSLGLDLYAKLDEWLGLMLLMPLGFGLSFQLPLVMLFLQRIGVFTTELYWSKWRVAVLLIAIASMVLTPTTDPYNMMLMFIPLSVLYFGGIWLCQWLPSPARKPGEVREFFKRSEK
jgi:sec-independent protein translocase protein TatC